jgi:L-asparaginase/Glu-tRNA(Gln) amidotransferase subunit D
LTCLVKWLSDFTDEETELIRKKVEPTPLEGVVVTHGTDTTVDNARVLKNISGKTTYSRPIS